MLLEMKLLYCSEPGRGTKSTRHGLDGSLEGTFIYKHNLVSGEVNTDAQVWCFPLLCPGSVVSGLRKGILAPTH